MTPGAVTHDMEVPCGPPLQVNATLQTKVRYWRNTAGANLSSGGQNQPRLVTIQEVRSLAKLASSGLPGVTGPRGWMP